jgi:hypothetical protein
MGLHVSIFFPRLFSLFSLFNALIILYFAYICSFFCFKFIFCLTLLFSDSSSILFLISSWSIRLFGSFLQCGFQWENDSRL